MKRGGRTQPGSQQPGGLLRVLLLASMSVLVSLGAMGEDVGSVAGRIEHPVGLGDPNAPFLFVIEENHASLAVQRDVQRIIEMLASTLDVRVILAEGTSPSSEGEAPALLSLDEIPGPTESQYSEPVVAAWFDFGLLSGIEMAALSASGESLSTYGVEDPQARAWFDFLRQLGGSSAGDLRMLLDDLLTEIAGRPASVMELIDRPLVPDYVSDLPALLEAVRGVRESAEVSSGGPATSFEQVLGDIAVAVGQGMSLPDAAAVAGADLLFDTDGPTVCSLSDDMAAARERLYVSIISTAEGMGLDCGAASEALSVWQEWQLIYEEALDERHPPMVDNVLAALDAARARAGILVIGAGHSAGLQALLKERGISFLFVTPTSLASDDASLQESEWFYRNLQLENDDEYTPISTWLLGYKPELVTADARHRDALAFSIGLTGAVDALMTGAATVPDAIRAGMVTSDVRIEDVVLDGYAAISLSGANGKTLRIEVPRAPAAQGGLSAEDARQLALFMLETLASEGQSDDSDSLRPGEEAAIRFYDDGAGVKALMAVRTSEDEQVIRLIPPVLPDLRATDLATEYAYILGSVEEFRKATQDASLIARYRGLLGEVMRHLETFAGSFDPDLGLVFPIALQFDRSADAIRETNFNLVHALLYSSGAAPSPQRRVLFVNSASQEDRPDETSLGKTLHNIHAYARTERRVAVITVPGASCSLSEWKMHPYAQELTAEWKLSQSAAWKWYKQQYGPRVEELVAAVGNENVCFPRNAGEMMEQMRSLLAGTASASITITLVAHTSGSGTLELAFPDGMSALDDALWTLRQLQDGGGLPSGPDVEFDMLACDFGAESAATVLGMLGARLVLASPHSVSFYGASYFDSYLTAERQSGVPLHEAYLRALKALVEDVANLGLDEECTDLLWVPQLYSVDVRKGESVTG